MVNVDLWTWKCLRCGWEVKSQFTINPQQAIAEALINIHIKEHDAVDFELTGHTSRNARLIAAAPELLEALKWAERKFRVLVTEDDGSGVFIRGTGTELAGFGAGVEKMRAAIKKADGADARVSSTPGTFFDIETALQLMVACKNPGPCPYCVLLAKTISDEVKRLHTSQT
jgi:hypothetical protein